MVKSPLELVPPPYKRMGQRICLRVLSPPRTQPYTQKRIIV